MTAGLLLAASAAPFLGEVDELFFEVLETGGGDSESEKETLPDFEPEDKESRSRENRDVPREDEG